MPFLAPDMPQTEAAIVQMTNAFRAENHLGAVVPNPVLKATAQAFADYLARTGSFAHTADGRQPAERAEAAGYRYCVIAENLAMHQSNRGFATTELAQSAVEGWKNSPPHRANLLQPYVTETGIGIAKASDADPKFLTVQLFGRPGSFKYTVDIENRSGSTAAYILGDQKNTIADSTRVSHTACVPRELTFDLGKVTSKYEAHDGETFVIARGPDGKPSVTLTTSHSATTPHAHAAGLLAAKAIKPGH